MRQTFLSAEPPSGAIFSENKQYRYRLWRRWNGGKGTVVFVMLNPSTATEVENDPTIKRCIDFAKRWGYQGLEVVNVFAYRTPYPGVLKAIKDPVGELNLEAIKQAISEADLTVAAWGNNATMMPKLKELVDEIRSFGPLFCLGKTASGQPKHPLYIRKDQELESF